tara:strand:- start:2749 stop:3903 length:1155 start_codon:yes stop_codon:yes gene_type:complete
MGNMLGQGIQKIAGGDSKENKIKQILQQVSNIADPVGQAQEAYKLFTQANLPKEAQMMMERIKVLRKEDRTEQKDLAAIDANTALAEQRRQEKKSGTADERANTTLSGLELKLTEGTPLSPSEKIRARGIIESLKKDKQIRSTSGDIINIKGYNAAATYPLLSKEVGLVASGVGGAGGAGGGVGDVTEIATSSGDASRAAETFRFESAIEGTNTALQNIQAIQDFKGAGTGWAALFSIVPDSDAMAVADLVSSLKSEQGLGELEKLKSMSATGASGLGATNQQEVGMLQNRIRNLNPKNKEQFAKDLEFIKTKWQAIIKRYEERLKQIAQNAPPGSSSKENQPSSNTSTGKKYTKEQYLVYLRKQYPNKTDAELENALRAQGKI